ncbi:hypothetical protein [Segatella buccae]|nr:hypothetical protein [Segatella buccae]
MRSRLSFRCALIFLCRLVFPASREFTSNEIIQPTHYYNND